MMDVFGTYLRLEPTGRSHHLVRERMATLLRKGRGGAEDKQLTVLELQMVVMEERVRSVTEVGRD